MPESTATYSDGSARVEATGHARMQALGEKDRQDAVSAGIVKGAGERAAEALALVNTTTRFATYTIESSAWVM